MVRFLILPLLLLTPTLAVGQSALGSVLLFPHVADGDGYTALIEIENLVPVAGDVTIEFFDSTGSSTPLETNLGQTPLTRLIGSAGPVRIETLGAGGLRTGWVRVTSSVRAWAQVVQRYPFGEEVFSSAIERSGFSTQARFDSTRGLNTGLAIANPGASAVRLDISLKDPASPVGGRPGTVASKQVVLAPGGQVARFLTEEPFFSDFLSSRASFDGTIEVRVSDAGGGSSLDARVAAMTIRFSAVGAAFNFSTSQVRPLPYADMAALSDNQLQLVYFIEKDRSIPSDVDYRRQFPNLIGLAGELIALEVERAGLGRRRLEFAPEVQVLVGRKNAADYPANGFARVVEVLTEVREAYGNARVAVTGESLLTNGGGGLLTFASDSLAQMEALESLMAGGGRVTLNDAFIPASRVFAIAHELGHAYGALPHTRAIEDDPTLGSRFYNLMSISVTSKKVGMLRSLFPGVDWSTSALSPEDLRHPTFSGAELRQLLAGDCGLPGDCRLEERD